MQGTELTLGLVSGPFLCLASHPCRACLPSQGTSDRSLALSLSSYSSGGEDGYVRIHYFDPQYFEFEFEA